MEDASCVSGRKSKRKRAISLSASCSGASRTTCASSRSTSERTAIWAPWKSPVYAEKFYWGGGGKNIQRKAPASARLDFPTSVPKMGWGAHGIVPKLARHRKRRTPFGEIDEWGGPSISDTVGLEELGLATRPIGYRFKPAIRQHFPRLGWAPVFHRPRFYVGKPGAEKNETKETTPRPHGGRLGRRWRFLRHRPKSWGT